MPNDQIQRPIADSLRDAFGGSQPSPAPQPSAPVAPPSGGSATGPSMWQALVNALYGQKAHAEQVDPYSNFANKATGKDYK